MGICRDGFAVVRDSILVTPVEDKEVGNACVPFGTVADFRRPSGWFVVQQVKRGVDGDGLEGVRLDFKRQVGFFGGTLVVVVLQSHAGLDFVGTVEFGVDGESFVSRLGSFAVEFLSLHLGQTEPRLCVLWVDFEGFEVELGGVRGVEAFEKELGPTHAVICVGRVRHHDGTESFAGTFEITSFPERLGCRESRGKARVIAWRQFPLCVRLLREQRQCDQQSDRTHSPETAHYFSIASWVRASSNSSALI